MKQFKLTFLLTVLMSMVGVKALAYDIAIANTDGVTIYYDWINNYSELAVTSDDESFYSGNVVIPESVSYLENNYRVTSIDDEAFIGCSGLTSITIPNSIESIGEGAFGYCSGLKTVELHCAYIGYWFRDIPSIEHIIVGDEVTYISNTAFDGTAWYNNQEDGLVYAGKVAYKYKGTMPANTNIVLKEGTLGIASSAFYGCSGLTSITIPSSVVDIGEGVFTYCNNLTSVTINSNSIASKDYGSNNLNGIFGDQVTEYIFGDDVTIIGNHALSGLSNLTSIILGNSITNIGFESFWGCTGITSISIPNSLTSIGGYAFGGCSGLTSINIPNSVTSIGYRAFNGCSNLTLVIIPNSVTSIGEGAFSGCSGLTSVVIGTGVTDLGKYSFSGCDMLKTVELHCHYINTCFQYQSSIEQLIIGDEVTSIDNRAFEECTGLTMVSFGSGLTTIGWSAFRGCSALPTISIPNSVTTINASTFGDCSSLTSVNLGNGVTEILDSSFKNCINLTSINIPNSVTSIGANAFSGCSGLTSINIPNSVTGIGDYAFAGCSGLTSVVVGNGVIGIGKYAFSGCNSLNTIELHCSNIGSWFRNIFTIDKVIIGDEVTSIDSNAFSDCTGIQKVIVSDVSTWCGISFSNYKSNPLYYAHHLYSDENTEIINLVIPEGVANIGKNAFYGCGDILSISLPNSLISIGSAAFSDCSGLTSVTIPNNVTSIGVYAFEKCTGLTSINIPNSVTSIGDNAFSGCSGLTSITIPNSVTSIGGSTFYGCSGLESIELHCNEISIWFNNNASIKSVLIGDEATSIGDYAFYSCNGLTSVTIGCNVSTIGDKAFNCSNLTTVTVKSLTPASMYSDTFTNRWNATLYVPAGSLPAYQSAGYWKEFKEIVEYGNPTDISALDNIIYLDEEEAISGSQKTVSIKMKNTAAIRGFQFNMTLPEGVTPATYSNGTIICSLSDARRPEGDQHTISVTQQADGSYLFLCGSLANETFTGNDGEVLTLKINIADNMAAGDYLITLSSIKLTETDITKYYETAEVVSKLTISDYELGDINGDNTVDVSDYIGVANHILGNTPASFNALAADVNGDHAIDILDYVGVANIILTGSIYGNNASSRPLVESEEPTHEPQ